MMETFLGIVLFIACIMIAIMLLVGIIISIPMFFICIKMVYETFDEEILKPIKEKIDKRKR